MQSYAIKSLIPYALGVALIAGCASPSQQSASAMQTNIQSGKVSSVDSGASAGQPSMTSSSGSSASGMAASGGPALVIVDFADGTQGRYYSSPFPVGTPVDVVTMGDRTVMRPHMMPSK